jgi:hypothetical protein
MARSANIVAVFAVLAAALPLCAKEREFPMPAAQDARSYAAHDDHMQEKVAIGADIYDTPQKNSIFQNHYFEHGLLPVFVVISNDAGQPLSLGNMQVELDLGHRSHVGAANDDEILRRMITPPSPGPSKIPIPVPLPHKHSSKEQAILNEVQKAKFPTADVAPHASTAGFFFFDISGMDAPLSTGRLIISGLRKSDGAELFYFEIPLAKAISTSSSP